MSEIEREPPSWTVWIFLVVAEGNVCHSVHRDSISWILCQFIGAYIDFPIDYNGKVHACSMQNSQNSGNRTHPRGSNVTITHDALDLTVHYIPRHETSRNIWWPSLETCSSLFTSGQPPPPPLPSPPNQCWNRWCASYWKVFLMTVSHDVIQYHLPLQGDQPKMYNQIMTDYQRPLLNRHLTTQSIKYWLVCEGKYLQSDNLKTTLRMRISYFYWRTITFWY